MIEIKVTGSTPAEALSLMCAFGLQLAGLDDISAQANPLMLKGSEITSEKVQETPMPFAPVMSEPNTEAPKIIPLTPAAPTAPVTPPAIPSAPVGTAAVPLAPAPAISLEQVAKAGADLISGNPAKMQELVALLQRFGVPAVQALKPDQIGAFATELRGLGAQI